LFDVVNATVMILLAKSISVRGIEMDRPIDTGQHAAGLNNVCALKAVFTDET
jgi:hypothetical protein